jgi:putative lipoprotein
MKPFHILIASFGLALLANCAPVDQPPMAEVTPPASAPAADEPTLVGVEWVATDIDDAPAAAGVRSTLTFGADGRVTGKGGCNSYFGTYKLDDDDGLAISAIGSTKMACPGPQMTQETKFLSILGGATKFAFEDDGALVVMAGEDQSVLLRHAP